MATYEYEDFGTNVQFPKVISVSEKLWVRSLLSSVVELHIGDRLELKTINLEGEVPTACYKVENRHHYHTGQTRGRSLPPNITLKNEHDFFVVLSLQEVEDYIQRVERRAVEGVKFSALRSSILQQLKAIGEVDGG